jgi:hypothetical protein
MPNEHAIVVADKRKFANIPVLGELGKTEKRIARKPG